jgi:outer membrane protein assembly factor BamB
MTETLEDHLRRATRNGTRKLAEDEALAVGLDLLRELERAASETPPRVPDIEPAVVPLAEGKPRLDGAVAGRAMGDALFDVGCLLAALLGEARPDVSWRLDGPPLPALSTVARRAILRGLTATARAGRFQSAAEAATALSDALAPAATTPAPWATFRGDASRSGARPGIAATRQEPVWLAAVGPVVASPVLTASQVLVPAADGRLLFLDRRTGRVLHELPIASAIESSPSLDGTTLHVGTDDGELVAVDVLRGEVLSRVKIGRLVRSSPLVLPGAVHAGSVDDKVGAFARLDLAKGKLAWTRKGAACFSSPALSGDLLLIGSDAQLDAFDAAGNAVWTLKTAGKTRATPAVLGEVAVVADFAGQVQAVSARDGALRWTRELGSPVYSSACLAAGLAVLGTHDGRIVGLDLGSGAVRFELLTRGPVVASPVACGERFLVGSTDGDLYLLDAQGTLLQRTTLARGGIASSAALDGDLLVVGSAAGVHALRLLP